MLESFAGQGGHGRGFVVARATRTDGGRLDTPNQMPLVLVETLTAVREAGASPQDDRPEVHLVETDLLDQLTTRGLLRRLPGFDASAGRIPVAAPNRIRIEQEQQAPTFVEQQNACHTPLDCRNRLHAPPNRASAYCL